LKTTSSSSVSPSVEAVSSASFAGDAVVEFVLAGCAFRVNLVITSSSESSTAASNALIFERGVSRVGEAALPSSDGEGDGVREGAIVPPS
jgi:hypothetical protein